MRPRTAVFLLVLLCVAAGCGGSRVPVYVPSQVNGTGDPPSRVARLSYVLGEVSMRPAGEADWVAAERNRPLTTGDTLWTSEPGGRAELHLGNAAIRTAAGSMVTLTEVGSNVTQVKLAGGVLGIRVRELDEDEEFEIDTPDAAIRLLRAGDYRVEVGSPGTLVAVRGGTAEVSGPAGSFAFTVPVRQEARIPGVDGQQRYTLSALRPADEFDAFCAERDRREERALAEKRLPPRLIGYEDLYDVYGEWATYPEWGPVWVPRAIPAGWAPYRFGHWVWIEPWGWTWIDEAPWGFAPFHYGRWVFVSPRWGWIPGPYHRHPIYAPALVVFIGAGGPGFRVHFRVGLGPGVAWFPLGPREVWLPPYRASRTYVTNINIRHTEIRNPGGIHRLDPARQRYQNRGVDGGVTAVPEDVFRRARPVHPGAVRVSPAEASRAPVGGSAPPFAPVRESLGRRPETAGAKRGPPPPRTVQRERQPAVTRRPAPASPTPPFEQRKPHLDRTPGRVPSAQPPATAKPPATVRPPTRSKQDQQWERRTSREETQRQTRIERDRQQQHQQQQHQQQQKQRAEPRQQPRRK